MTEAVVNLGLKWLVWLVSLLGCINCWRRIDTQTVLFVRSASGVWQEDNAHEKHKYTHKGKEEYTYTYTNRGERRENAGLATPADSE